MAVSVGLDVKTDVKKILKQMDVDLRKYMRKVLKETAEGFSIELKKEVSKHTVTGNLLKSIHRKGERGGWEQNVYAAKYIKPMSYGTRPHPLPKRAFWYIVAAVKRGKYGRWIWWATKYDRAVIIKKIIERKGTKPTGVIERVWNRRDEIIRKAMRDVLKGRNTRR